MEIIIKGDPKEIAALVASMQEQQGIDRSQMAEDLQRALDSYGSGMGIKLCADED